MFARIRRRRPRGRAGFTLIEVLVAMVILAVGLLALEAMGIGAARMVARADRQGEFTAIAANEVEAALSTFRAGGTVQQVVHRQQGRADVTVLPTVTNLTAQGPAGTASLVVEVTVAPVTGANPLGVQPVTMVGRAIR